MTAVEIVEELRQLGKEGYKKILLNHGVPEPLFGVSVAEMKKIQKRIKKDYQLALDLHDTGIYEAMYLAGLISDDAKMTKKDLRSWAAKTKGNPLCGFAVVWVAAESRYGWELATEWIESKKESLVVFGWATLSSLVGITDDADLDLPQLKKLIGVVQKTIHKQPDRVRYMMNGFLIAVAAYVKSLTDIALQAAEKIGEVKVDMGKTSCKVPFAPDYIRKIIDRGTVGKKRKTCKC